MLCIVSMRIHLHANAIQVQGNAFKPCAQGCRHISGDPLIHSPNPNVAAAKALHTLLLSSRYDMVLRHVSTLGRSSLTVSFDMDRTPHTQNVCTRWGTPLTICQKRWPQHCANHHRSHTEEKKLHRSSQMRLIETMTQKSHLQDTMCKTPNMPFPCAVPI
jgi:hypothetical protein